MQNGTDIYRQKLLLARLTKKGRQPLADTAVTRGCGNVVCGVFYCIICGSHSNSAAGKFQHTNVVDAIVSNTEIIPAASDGKKLLMLFTGKDQSICEAEIKKTGISVNPEQRYYLSFDVMASYLPTNLKPVFKFWIRDENMQIYTQTFTELKDKWEHIEVPFSSLCGSIEYGFYGNIYSGGIFVDNVNLQTMKSTSILQPTACEDLVFRQSHNTISITSPVTTYIKINSSGGQLMDDMQISKGESVYVCLKSGIYIIKTSTGHSYKLNFR